MLSLVNCVQNEVNLESYSASPGFVGYFERAGRYIDGLAEDAVSLLIERLRKEWGEWTLVSSLHANQDEVGHFGDSDMDARDIQLVSVLFSCNVLQEFSYRTRFGIDYESPSYRQAVVAACLAFNEKPCSSLDYDVVMKLLVARMLVYGIRGHCFLVSSQRGLIIYPHDDTGFGFIGIGDSPTLDLAYDILKAATQIGRFHSVVAR